MRNTRIADYILFAAALATASLPVIAHAQASDADALVWTNYDTGETCGVENNDTVPWTFYMRASSDGENQVVLLPADPSAIVGGSEQPARFSYGDNGFDVTAHGVATDSYSAYVVQADLATIGMFASTRTDGTPFDIALTAADGTALYAARPHDHGQAFQDMADCVERVRADLDATHALASAAAQFPLPEPDANGERPLVPFENGWVWGEAGNNCIARFQRPDGSYAMMALTKWNDLSDAILYWRPGLEPMADPEPDESASQAEIDAWEEQASSGWGVGLEIDQVPFHLATLISDSRDAGDPDRLIWRIGVLQQEFLDALATGESLTIARNGEIVDQFPVANSRGLAAMLRQCVAMDISL
jgi:hypothetical protein